MYENIVRSFGAILDNRALYGPGHKVTIQSLEQAYELLTQTLSTEESLLLAINPDEFLINRQIVETSNPLVQRFADLLRAHEISTLTLAKDITPDEFIALVNLIFQDPAALSAVGGAAKALLDPVFSHVESRKVTYVEITEDETVITKEELGDEASRGVRDEAVMEYLGVLGEDAPQPAAEPPAPGPEPSPAPDPMPDPAPDVAEGLQELMTCPAEFGELLIQNVGAGLDIDLANAPQSTPSATTKLLIDRVVKCLERAFAVLKADRSAGSQKGKKALIKSLQALEKDVDGVIREAIKPIEDEDLAPISSAIEAMTDELAVDALAAEYLRKRKLIEASEKRLLRYMARQGEEIDGSELKAKLIDGGLPATNWDMLLLTSGVKLVPDTLDELAKDIPGFKHLHQMLRQLADFFQNVDPKDGAARERIKKLIVRVEERLEKLVNNTRIRMERLSSHVAEEEPAHDTVPSDAARRKSRTELLALIAEIVQELCQPLSVVQCTIDVLLSEQIEAISHAERDILELACRSSRRLGILINELFSIVGHPADLVPKELTKELNLTS